MIRKWIKAIFTHPVNIIKGNFNRLFGLNDLLYIHRYYKHCYKCKEKENSPIGEICGICGCPLESKLRVKNEKCEINKF